MKRLARGLLCATTVSGNRRRFNYLIESAEGNVLVHGLDRAQYRALAPEIERRGGVRYQLLCHWHEVKKAAPALYQGGDIQVIAPGLELPLIETLLPAGTRLRNADRAGSWIADLVPRRVSGHTVGFTVYAWRGFLFGGDFIVRRGTQWTSLFESAHVEAGLRGMDALRAMAPERWLPLKCSGDVAPPFDFGPEIVDQAETKLRRKLGLPRREPAHPGPRKSGAARPRRSAERR